jgi:hypothetical protein
MMAEVIRMAIGLRELAEQSGEGRTTVRIECCENTERAELVILREDILCGHLHCDLKQALEMLAGAHELFRLRGHGLRVEIVARRPSTPCLTDRPASD